MHENHVIQEIKACITQIMMEKSKEEPSQDRISNLVREIKKKSEEILKSREGRDVSKEI